MLQRKSLVKGKKMGACTILCRSKNPAEPELITLSRNIGWWELIGNSQRSILRPILSGGLKNHSSKVQTRLDKEAKLSMET